MRGTKTLRGIENGTATWRLRAWVGDPDHPKGGRQISKTFRISVTGDSTGVRAAQAALEDFVREEAVRGTREDQTVKVLADRWLEDCADRLAYRTVHDYRLKLKRMMIFIGKIKLRDLTPEDLNRLYRRELDRGVSASTVLKYHRVLSTMFREAERWGWIAKSPTRNARPPRNVQAKKFDTPSIDMVQVLVDRCESNHMRLAIRIAAATGARRGEICALRWEDVDLKKNYMLIHKSVYEGPKGDEVKTTKTNNRRMISIDNKIAFELKAFQGRSRGYIFSDDDGVTPWRPDRITKEFAVVRAKVRKAANVRFHDLRHFHATRLLAAGMDPVTVSKRLGHAKVSTTIDIYAAALEEMDRKAAEIAESWDLTMEQGENRPHLRAVVDL
jgi:integrase